MAMEISKTNILAKGQGSCTMFDYRRLFRTFSDILLTSAHLSLTIVIILVENKRLNRFAMHVFGQFSTLSIFTQ
jgi:hypothetical protein